MPKVNWAGEGEEDILTAADIEGAEDGFQAYAGDLPPGGVYRFRIGRMKFTKANSTTSKGLNVRLRLDGSWKANHAKFDGCPLWDTVWITKGSAGFVKAFCQAIGVSAADILNKVVVDEDGYVTKIGTKPIKDDDIVVYVAVKRGEYNDTPRLEKAGTGYQIVEADGDTDGEETSGSAKKAAPAKAAKGKGKKAKNEDDEPPF